MVKNFFHKIKIAFIRAFEPSIPCVSEAKKYGDYEECKLIDKIHALLPSCKIKKNVIIQSFEGNAEIDCLILYKNKLFAIEIKSWKGNIIEQEEGFIQEKKDRWTNDIYKKFYKSPFKQLKRSIYLLKKCLSSRAWINSIVFFESAENVFLQTEEIWFSNIEELVYYIKYGGKEANSIDASVCFEKSIPADCLYARGESLHCIISNDSLYFQTEKEILSRRNIYSINIKHHWFYDELLFCLKDGSKRCFKEENAKIKVDDNGKIITYALCKLDHIELGKEI